jgi:FixJ family two-component response regulator
MHNLSRLNSGPPGLPNDQLLGLPGDGVFRPCRFQDLAHLARSDTVTSRLVSVIDDDEALCSSLADLLRSVGYRVEQYGSAEAFLTSSNLFSFDCVLADIHMPGMSGLDLLRGLHRLGITTPVILITALPDKHLDDEAISLGAHCLLRKPFETSYLLDCVERSLQ